jgi:hypothetical protein
MKDKISAYALLTAVATVPVVWVGFWLTVGYNLANWIF